MELKKDLNPVWIYLGLFFVFQSILLTVLQIPLGAEKATAITFIVIYTIIFGILIAMYYKRVLADIKRLSWKSIILIIGISAVMFFVIEFIASLLPTAANEEAVTDLLRNYRFWMALPIALFGPFTEEMVFRYSFSSFMRNDIVFLLVSSSIFALMHMNTIGIEILVYFLMGLFLGLVYLLTKKNVAASTLAHITNNFIEVLMILFFSIG